MTVRNYDELNALPPTVNDEVVVLCSLFVYRAEGGRWTFVRRDAPRR